MRWPRPGEKRPDAGARPVARVGPNAALQVLAALRRQGEGVAESVFAQAGLADWVDHPPGAMIAEADAARLHAAVRFVLQPTAATAVLSEAGRSTADYLLANRIPAFAQLALRCAPASLAARWLTRAIGANAWTFAGSGRFSAHSERTMIYEISGNPFCAGAPEVAGPCLWHAAVFERLFAALVSKSAQAQETACCAAGSPCCRFVMTWQASGR